MNKFSEYKIADFSIGYYDKIISGENHMSKNNRSNITNIINNNQTDQDLEYIPLTNDLLFHMVFTKNKTALQSLLSSILNIAEEEILEIEILNPMQYTDAIDTKLTVLDLKLHLNHQQFILVEMQVRRFQNWTNRTVVYTCRQIADQVKGDQFEYDKVQPVVQIAIMDHTLFVDHKRFLSKYSLRDEDGYQYSDKLQFYVLDLTAISDANEQEKEQGLVEWANAFRAKDWTSFEQIDNSGVKEAMKTMRVIMSTPSERQLLWDRKMAILDYKDSIGIALQRGHEEGRKEGMKEGMKEGLKEGEKKMGQLMAVLVQKGRFDDIARAANEPEFRNQLYKELNIE